MTSFIPSFRLSLAKPIQPGLVACGRFDGQHPSLAFATSSDTILLHSPHSTSPEQLHTLAINRRITALTAGSLSSTLSAAPTDQLLVGGDTSLLCYDVHNNRDLFFADIKDGCHALTIGRLSASALSPALCLVGGNSAVSGLDMMGLESYWTATSDTVGAIATRPAAKDSSDLLIGTADSAIRIVSGSEVTAEVHEAAAVKVLTSVQGSCYGFALHNGTVGVYNNHQRLWMAKSKHTIHSLSSFDLDGDGVNELVSGWSHGRLEVRNQQTGELVYKDKFSAPVAAVLSGDLRGEGAVQLIACGADGEVRGYAAVDESTSAAAAATPAAVAAGGVAAPAIAKGAVLADEEMLDGKRKDLYDRKNELLDQLQLYENAIKNHGKTPAKDKNATTTTTASVASSPSTTQLTVSIKPNKSTSSNLLTVTTNNDCVIKMLVVTADGLFTPNESKCVIPTKEKQSGSISLAFKSDKNVSVSLRIRVMVGHRGGANDSVFEFNEVLPRFSNFLYCKPRDMQLPQPKGSVTFHTTERVNRVVLWLNAAFHLDTNPSMSANGAAPSPLTLSVSSDSLLVSFLHLLTNTPLTIKMSPDGGGTITVRTDNMELAGDLITDLCQYCKIDECDSVCDFANEFQTVEQLMTAVSAMNDVRLRASADMADAIQRVKMGVIRAEDARLIGEVADVRKLYANVYTDNREMLGEYKKRENNQQELLKNLKEINQYIQRAARCRMGESKARVIAGCRQAIKNNNTKALLKIMRVGSEKD